MLYMQKLKALSALLRFLQEFLASNPGGAFRVCGELCQLWHNNGEWQILADGFLGWKFQKKKRTNHGEIIALTLRSARSVAD